MTKSQPTTAAVNGVDVDRMFETIAAIKKDPGLAKFRFRADNRWIDGGRNRSTVQGFHGAGREDDTRREPFVMEADEPHVLLGEDSAPNPVEFLLHALGACLTTSMAYHAAARGIQIESIESQIEGDMDLRGFLGIAPDVRKGYQGIRVTFRVKSDAPAEKLAELASFSPVRESLEKPVPVTIKVQKV